VEDGGPEPRVQGHEAVAQPDRVHRSCSRNLFPGVNATILKIHSPKQF
jgi:hypothetical protein